jgi:hypothetical protein
MNNAWRAAEAVDMVVDDSAMGDAEEGDEEDSSDSGGEEDRSEVGGSTGRSGATSSAKGGAPAPPSYRAPPVLPAKQAAATHVTLLPSIFAHRPPTIFFERPPGLPPRDAEASVWRKKGVGEPSEASSSSSGRSSSAPLPLPPLIHVPLGKSRSVCMRIEKNANSVRNAFKRAGFGINLPKEKQSPAVTWSRCVGDKLWTQLPVGAIVNHFPGSWTLGHRRAAAAPRRHRVRVRAAHVHLAFGPPEARERPGARRAAGRRHVHCEAAQLVAGARHLHHG